jgi:MFS superfamily sulfate permease-like transporter
MGMIDIATVRTMRTESPGEFKLALIAAAAVAFVGVEQGVLLAVTLSLLRHVRQSYRPHTAVLHYDPGHGWTHAPATAGHQSEPGLVIYRFGAALFYANAARFADQIRTLIAGAPDPVRWLIVEADAITDIDYTAARVLLALIEDLAREHVQIAFVRVSSSLREDMDRHNVTAAIGADNLFVTRHEALAKVAPSTVARSAS